MAQQLSYQAQTFFTYLDNSLLNTEDEFKEVYSYFLIIY